MSRSLSLAILVALSCGGNESLPAPQVTITFRPEFIDNLGTEAVITIEGTDERGKPGTGTVKVSTGAGSLLMGQSVTLDAKGRATATFDCIATADPNCNGAVKIRAVWTRTGGNITNFRSIYVGP